MRHLLATAWALSLAIAVVSGAAAQERPDTARREAADTTLSPEEALRRSQLERLKRLSRPVGQDTLELQALDTLQAEAQPRGGLQSRGGQARQGGAMASDTLVDRLLDALPGYEAIQYEGTSAIFDAEQRDLLLFGDTASRPRIRYQGQELSADSVIHYREPSEIVSACCRTVYTPLEGGPVESERLVVNTGTQEASAFGAETEYQEGGTKWLVSGDLPRVGSEVAFGSHARFTSCDLTVPHYHFETDELKIVRGSVLVARPVRLYFADVPVAWLPFVAQSLSEGRASGLLTPRFSVNDIVRTSGGYKRRLSNVGFYWAMNDYMDATLAMDWFSGNFTALTGALRYQWLRQFMSGSFNARQYWREGGGTEFGLDARHSWEMSERTSMNGTVSFASSRSFVRQNTFNPLELTQQIRSQGGFNHRFDWGNLSLSGSRVESLSDDRVDLSLPDARLSISSITLFPAPFGSASWYNNMTWSGGASLSRQLQDQPDQPADSFLVARVDREATMASANHTISVGNLSLSQSAQLRQGSQLGVPRDSLVFFPVMLSPAEAARLTTLGSAQEVELVDATQATVDWTTTLGYQQTLIGSTTLTPSISFSGQMLRSDTIEAAQEFVSGPSRVSLGASLRSDIYGFFPGFASFEAIRHKVSPSFSYDWAPEVQPTELQTRVFGARTLQPRSVLNIGINQTFEAKRKEAAAEEQAPGTTPAPPAADTIAPEQAGAFPEAPAPGEATGEGGPRRRQQGRVVNLLSLRTSSVTYDFVQADSAGDFLLGFQTSRLRNEISSDFLQGLTLSVEHDLFADSSFTDEGGDLQRERSFDPQLSAVNLGFSLTSRSAIFRWLGLGGSSSTTAPAEVGEGEEDPLRDPMDPFGERSATDETSIIPGTATDTEVREGRRPTGNRDWNASFSYALIRPRAGGAGLRETTQSLQIGVNMNPTEHWDLSWRTSYDLELGQFNDHAVRLTRDLHRWQANFDFLKTATGNWTFRFEVSLLDNRDLKFDYQQRNLETSGARRPSSR